MSRTVAVMKDFDELPEPTIIVVGSATMFILGPKMVTVADFVRAKLRAVTVAIPGIDPASSVTVATPSLLVVTTGTDRVPKVVESETNSFGTGFPYSSIMVTAIVDWEELPDPAVIVVGFADMVMDGAPVMRTASKGIVWPNAEWFASSKLPKRVRKFRHEQPGLS